MRGGSEFRRALASAPRPAGCQGFARAWTFGGPPAPPDSGATRSNVLHATCSSGRQGISSCLHASLQGYIMLLLLHFILEFAHMQVVVERPGEAEDPCAGCSHHLLTPLFTPLHTTCSHHRLFTPPVHTSCSHPYLHYLFTPPYHFMRLLHTFCSRLMFTPYVHTFCFTPPVRTFDRFHRFDRCAHGTYALAFARS